MMQALGGHCYVCHTTWEGDKGHKCPDIGMEANPYKECCINYRNRNDKTEPIKLTEWGTDSNGRIWWRCPTHMTVDPFRRCRDCLEEYKGRNKLNSNNTMDFSTSLLKLKEGLKMARTGWNGTGMHIQLQVPDANSKMGLPYLYMQTVSGALVPWLASQTDLMAEDWYEVA